MLLMGRFIRPGLLLPAIMASAPLVAAVLFSGHLAAQASDDEAHPYTYFCHHGVRPNLICTDLQDELITKRDLIANCRSFFGKSAKSRAASGSSKQIVESDHAQNCTVGLFFPEPEPVPDEPEEPIMGKPTEGFKGDIEGFCGDEKEKTAAISKFGDAYVNFVCKDDTPSTASQPPTAAAGFISGTWCFTQADKPFWLTYRPIGGGLVEVRGKDGASSQETVEFEGKFLSMISMDEDTRTSNSSANERFEIITSDKLVRSFDFTSFGDLISVDPFVLGPSETITIYQTWIRCKR